jgi:L-fuculose-phosphate aldolase
MSWNEERNHRQRIVEIHRRLYELGFSVANDGNTSVRVDRKRFLVTPMDLPKARLTPEQIVMVDSDGNPVGANSHPPSSERALHVAIYRARPDVQAIIHAHPPYAIACTLAGVSLSDYFLPEVIVSLGEIPTVPYATPSTKELAELAAGEIKKHDALILARHGTVTVGRTLDDAMDRLERVEHTAKIAAIARSMGTVTPLSKVEVERLLEISHPPQSPGDGSELKPATDAAKYSPELIELITREVRNALK